MNNSNNNRNRRDSNRNRDSRRSRSRSPRRSGGGNRGGDSHSTNNKMVFITNISYDVRWVDLKTLVREKGGEIVFCELLQDRNGKPKGNAVVEFETREGAENCVNNLGKFEFKGRNIIAKEIRDPPAFFRTIKNETGIDYLARTGGEITGTGNGHGGQGGGGNRRDDRQPRSGTYELFGLNMDFLRQHNIEPPLCERIFIANLAFNVGTEKIYEVFGMAGKITWMDFRIDKEGKSKGVCVLQYSHPIEAVQAIAMLNGQKLYDRNLVVKMDRFEKNEQEFKDGHLPKGLTSIGMGLGADGAPLANVSLVFGGGNESAPIQQQQQPQQAAPFSAPIPQNFGGDSSFSRQSLGGVGGGGNPFAANTNSSNFKQETVYEASFGIGNGSGGMGGGQQSGGRIIVIRNLPNDYTWQIVRDRVRQFGDVESVDMISPGTARVRFGGFTDAERARTSLFGTTVEGRVINVEFV